jgi:hypothetical protein
MGLHVESRHAENLLVTVNIREHSSTRRHPATLVAARRPA